MAINVLSFILLSPAFLAAGIALSAVPIIIHFLNRRRYRVVPWAAMEFLLAAIKKNRRRLRFESWLLLAARCAALLLLGLALARPMGCGNASMAALGQRTSLNVFIIDNSYSMAYRFPRGTAQTHLDQAKLITHTLLSRLEPGSEGVVLLSAAAPASQIIGQPTYDLPAANTAIDSISQSAAATDLPGALRQALTVAQHNSSLPNKRLYILTDSTRSALEIPESAALRELAAQLAKQYTITYFHLGRPHQQNLSVANLQPASHLITTKFPASLRADLNSFDISEPTTLQWKLDDRLINTTQVTPSTLTTAVALENLNFPTGGSHVLSITATTDDSLPIDNTAYRIINVASRLKVLLVEGDRASATMSGSAAFLNIALAPAQKATGPTDSYVEPTTISDLQLSGETLSDYRAVVLANVPTIDPREADALQNYVQSGGTLMIFMGELINADNYNQTLLPRGLLPGPLVRRMTAPAGTPFHFDFHPEAPLHPLLQFLHNQPRSGLETTEITTYWQVNLPENSKVERVLNFKDETKSSTPGEGKGGGPSAFSVQRSAFTTPPAITLQSLGSGRVLFFATTADAQWTTLPAKPVYVPLMHELLQGSIVPDDLWMNLTVGQRLTLPAQIKLTTQPELTTPAGRPLLLQTDPAKPGVYESRALSQPGIYTLNTGDTHYPVAVNPPPAEADIRTEPPSAIRSIFGDTPMDLEADQPPHEIAQSDEGRDFGWSAMLIVLGLLGVECFMAMKFGHYRR